MPRGLAHHVHVSFCHGLRTGETKGSLPDVMIQWQASHVQPVHEAMRRHRAV
jgi:hypothetical protein